MRSKKKPNHELRPNSPSVTAFNAIAMSLSARGRRRLPTTSARNDGQRLDMVGFFIDGSCSISYLLSTCGGEIYVDMRAACKASTLVFEAVRVRPERLDAVKRLLDSNIDIRSQAAHLFWSAIEQRPLGLRLLLCLSCAGSGSSSPCVPDRSWKTHDLCGRTIAWFRRGSL